MYACRESAYGPASAKSRSSTPMLVTNSVATAPGSTTHTVTPWAAATGARDSIMPSTANFAAQ